eukprot:4819299-Pleurochrysis_carterae.AAC.1
MYLDERHLVVRLGDVRLDPAASFAVLAVERAETTQQRGGAGRDEARREHRVDQPVDWVRHVWLIRVAVVHHRLGVLQRIRRPLLVLLATMPVHRHLAHKGALTCRAARVDQALGRLEVDRRKVHRRCRAVREELAYEPRVQGGRKVGVGASALGRERILVEPLHQRQIRGGAGELVLRGMHVRINHAWHQKLLRLEIDELARV